MKPETLSTTHRENIINGVQSYSSYSWLQTIHPPTTNNNKGTSPPLLYDVQKHTVNPRPAQQKQYRCNTTDGLQGSTTPLYLALVLTSTSWSYCLLSRPCQCLTPQIHLQSSSTLARSFASTPTSKRMNCQPE